jgi:hypothetical protein
MSTIVNKLVAKAENLIIPAVVLIVFLFGVIIVVDVFKSENNRATQLELADRLSGTEAGKFAINNFISCKKAGGAFSSPPSDALCIAETVNGAEKLRGREFGIQVTSALADWFDQSKRISHK